MTRNHLAFIAVMLMSLSASSAVFAARQSDDGETRLRNAPGAVERMDLANPGGRPRRLTAFHTSPGHR